MSERDWETTTHDWSLAVDTAHLDLIRRHPAHYCPGALHAVLEVMAYADDEAAALGRPGRCRVRLLEDGSVSVSDDGRGTDTRRPAGGQPVRKPVMATRDVRFFDSDDPHLLPDGLPRRGVSVVAALSDWLVHTNRREEGAWEQRYEHGVPTGPLRRVAAAPGQGTTVWYHLDPALVTGESLHPDAVAATARFRWLTVTL